MSSKFSLTDFALVAAFIAVFTMPSWETAVLAAGAFANYNARRWIRHERTKQTQVSLEAFKAFEAKLAATEAKVMDTNSKITRATMGRV